MSRRKGHSFERDIAKKLKQVFPKARRRLEYQADMAADGVDIDNTGVYAFQLKRLKNYAPINCIKEIQRKDCVNVLVTKADQEREVAVIYLDDFLKLIEYRELISDTCKECGCDEFLCGHQH